MPPGLPFQHLAHQIPNLGCGGGVAAITTMVGAGLGQRIHKQHPRTSSSKARVLRLPGWKILHAVYSHCQSA
jgi:hypothetical protein